MAKAEKPDARAFDPDRHILYADQQPGLPMYNEWGEELEGIVGRAGAVGPVGADDMGIDLVKMSPGSAFPLHVHPGNHILYIISGLGIVHVDGVDWPVAHGASVWIPAELPHGVKTYSPGSVQEVFVFLAFGFPHQNVQAHERMRIVDEGIRAQHDDKT